MLPYCLSIGISEEKFNDSCPVDLEPYFKAQQWVHKRRDEELWLSGIYNMNAVYISVGKLLHGRSFKEKYFEKPLSENLLTGNNNNKPEITEEQKQKSRDELLLQLQLMQANFEMNHKQGE